MSSESRKSRAGEVLRSLVTGGYERAEVFAKRGRGRRFEIGLGGRAAFGRREAGWAVRAGDDRCSFWSAASGEPEPAYPWPDPDGLPLVLPARASLDMPREPANLDAPLIGEREGFGLLDNLERELLGELPAARILLARLDDGASESWLESSEGVRAYWRNRVAALTVEVVGGGGKTASAALALREARHFDTRALAGRLAASLAVADGSLAARDRRDVVAAPIVGARLLLGLSGIFVGSRASVFAAPLKGTADRMGSPEFSIIDDGRYPDGALEAPCDGEGMPTRRVMLMEEGVYRRPLVSWSEARRLSLAPSGCSRRASWRDLPKVGPTHLYIRSDRRRAVGSLLGGLVRGFYLIDATGAAQFDFEEDRFELPVRGFAIEDGRARAPVAGALLTGAVSQLLRGVAAVARDLTFFPLDGMIGSPSLLLRGLEVRPKQGNDGQ